MMMIINITIGEINGDESTLRPCPFAYVASF